MGTASVQQQDVAHSGEGRGAEVRFGNAGSRRRRASARRLRETKGPEVKPPAAPRRQWKFCDGVKMPRLREVATNGDNKRTTTRCNTNGLVARSTSRTRSLRVQHGKNENKTPRNLEHRVDDLDCNMYTDVAHMIPVLILKVKMLVLRQVRLVQVVRKRVGQLVG